MPIRCRLSRISSRDRRLRALAERTDSALISLVQQWRWKRSVSTTSTGSDGSIGRLQWLHLSASGRMPATTVVVCRRQLAHVAVARVNGSPSPIAVVTARMSVRLTEQAKARHASHRGSPGHCSSNFRAITESSVLATPSYSTLRAGDFWTAVPGGQVRRDTVASCKPYDDSWRFVKQLRDIQEVVEAMRRALTK
jgi:hypothetical protein